MRHLLPHISLIYSSQDSNRKEKNPDIHCWKQNILVIIIQLNLKVFTWRETNHFLHIKLLLLSERILKSQHLLIV